MSIAMLRADSARRRRRWCIGRGQRLHRYRVRGRRRASGFYLADEQYMAMRREYHAMRLARVLRAVWPPDGSIFA